MKKLIFTLLAVSISGSATAEWTRVGGGDNDADIYVDLDTFRRNGDKVKLWALNNFKTLNGDTKPKHFSSKSQWELDCKEEQIRSVAFITYSGKNGGGNSIMNEYRPSDWMPPVPDTIGELIFNVGCEATIGTHKWILLDPTTVPVLKDNPNIRFYFDYSSMRKHGDRVRMWQLIDHRSKDHDPKRENHSVKFHREYDCIEQKVRTIAGAEYSTNMALGKSQWSTNDATPWEPVGGTVHEIWKTACEIAEE